MEHLRFINKGLKHFPILTTHFELINRRAEKSAAKKSMTGGEGSGQSTVVWRPVLGVFPWPQYFDTNPIVLAQAHSSSQRLRPVFESAAAAVALALNAKWILWTEE